MWRDRDTIQIGIDPRRAVAISGPKHASSVIGLLDGSRDRDDLVSAAAQHGVPREATERILTLLAAAGALVDYPAALLRAIPADRRRQLAPVLATASIAAQDGDGGARTLARRSATSIEIRGTGQVAAAIASLLAQSGLVVTSATPAGKAGSPAGGDVAADTAPHQAQPSRHGTRRAGKAAGPGSNSDVDGAAKSRQAASGRLGSPDLVVLVGQQPPGLDDSRPAGSLPHLMVYAGEALGVVGPLVQPGATACLRCLDLTRTDHDPAWPLILAQITRRCADPPACDPVLAAAVAAQAAAQVIAFADGTSLAGATANGTLELVLPAWNWRRRTWLPHPACICRACEAPDARSDAEPTEDVRLVTLASKWPYAASGVASAPGRS